MAKKEFSLEPNGSRLLKITRTARLLSVSLSSRWSSAKSHRQEYILATSISHLADTEYFYGTGDEVEGELPIVNPHDTFLRIMYSLLAVHPIGL